jgi:hypothetical protein
MRKRQYFTCLFDQADSADIRLYSALRTQLEEGLYHTLGTNLFLPVVTGTALDTRTTHSVFRLQSSKFRADESMI